MDRTPWFIAGAAVLVEGAPDRMDADLDGVPCEPVYAIADIIDYWGFDPR